MAKNDKFPEEIPEFTLEDIMREFGSGNADTEPEAPAESEGNAYRITNIPSDEATVSLTVKKAWDFGVLGQDARYEELTVRMALLANGEDTGLVGELSLRNGWAYTFEGLPKYDSRGSPIEYTVEELDLPNQWRAEYGPVIGIGDSETAYETTVTNVYRMTVELPSTGGIGTLLYILCGLILVLGPLVYGFSLRRRYGRRLSE